MCAVNTQKKLSKTHKKTGPDKTEKILEDHADVFADIINVCIYGGEQEVRPDDLIEFPCAAIYKAAEGNYSQKERDVAKINVREQVAYALFGLENQSMINYCMPVRIIGYDYAAYEKQVRDLKDKNKAEGRNIPYPEELGKEQKLFPVATLVLYFGTKPWTGPRSLYDILNVPESLKLFVPDYKINIIEVAFLEPETIAKFNSDFKTVAEYFRALRLGKTPKEVYNELKKTARNWDHVEELLEFFRTFTGDKRYSEIKQYMIEEAQKGEVNMCTLLDAFEREGTEKGRAEGIDIGRTEGIDIGRTEGIDIGRYRSLKSLIAKTGMSETEAMDVLSFTETEKSGYKVWLLKAER